MQILLSGAAGFIGSHLSERLLRDGHEVVGVDNFITGRPDNIQGFRDHPKFKFVEADVIRPLELNGAFDFDWVMHFASPASPPKYLARPLETLRVNSEGTFHMLETAKRHGAKFFLASTSEVYGDPEVHPQTETYWGCVNTIGPRAVYDEAKRYAEAITTSYHRELDLSIRIIRIFNTYGPRLEPEDGRVVSNFAMQALNGEPLTIYGDGTQTRSFQYVDDLVEGVVRLMGVEYCNPVNLGNPEEYSVLDLAEMITEITKSSSKIVFHPLPTDDPKQRRPDISVARRLLDWEPRVPVMKGLARTIEHYTTVIQRAS